MIAELQLVDTPAGAASADVFTKLYFTDISRKFRSGTWRGNTEYAMTLAPLLDASTAIQGHAFAAMAAFALGASSKTVSLVNLMRSLLLAHSATC
jgi:hypothetical protein